MSTEDLAATPTPEQLAKLVAKTQRELDTKPPKTTNQHPDPDEFLKLAKKLVVNNYNAHRDPKRTNELDESKVYFVWFAKTLANWKAIIASPVARNTLWEVTYNGYRKTAYVDCYRKVTNTAVSLGEDKAPE